MPAQADLLGGTGGLVGGLVGTVGSVAGSLLDTTSGLLNGSPWGYSAEVTTLTDVRKAIGADTLRTAGATGKGIGVALLDTGVVPVTGLTAGNVVNGPDLSFESQSGTLRNLDGFGHGTHLAGIISGNDAKPGGFPATVTLWTGSGSRSMRTAIGRRVPRRSAPGRTASARLGSGWIFRGLGGVG